MANCWERAVPLAFHCCFCFSAVLIVGVLSLFGFWVRMWNSIVSVPDHCIFIYLHVHVTLAHQHYAYEINGTVFKLI